MKDIYYKKVSALVKSHVEDWLENDVDELFEINQGYCADFADSFLRKDQVKDLIAMAPEGIDIDLRGLYDLDDLQDQGLADAPKPSWILWRDVELLVKDNAFNHTFIKAGEFYYDCECVDGVMCPLDLPIFKRAALEYFELASSNVAKTLNGKPVYRSLDTVDISTIDPLKYYDYKIVVSACSDRGEWSTGEVEINMDTRVALKKNECFEVLGKLKSGVWEACEKFELLGAADDLIFRLNEKRLKLNAKKEISMSI